MSTTSRQPYSDRAERACLDGAFPGLPPDIPLDQAERRIKAGMDAAHDRSVLGLDASARVGDVLNEVCAKLRQQVAVADGPTMARWLLDEFEAKT